MKVTMKNRSLILVCLLLIIPFFSHKIHADSYGDGYSDWSVIQTNAEGEVSKTQYKIQTPKEFIKVFDVSPVDSSLYYCFDPTYTEEVEETITINDEYWDNANAKTIFTYTFDDYVTITSFVTDVDVANMGEYGWENYATPALHLYADGTEVLSSPARNDADAGWENNNLSIKCKKIVLTMDRVAGKTLTACYGSTVNYKTEKMPFFVVTDWNDGVWGDYDYTPQDVKEVIGLENQYNLCKVEERTVYSRPLVYTITYDLNGGNNSALNPSTYTVLDTYKLKNPSKATALFLGWYLEPEFNNRLLDISKGMHQDLTLYARFEEIIYNYTGSYFTKGSDRANDAIYPASYYSCSYDIDYNTITGACEYK